MWTLVINLVLLGITLSNAFIPRFRLNYKYTSAKVVALSMNEAGGDDDKKEDTEAARQQRQIRTVELDDILKMLMEGSPSMKKAGGEGDQTEETEAARKQRLNQNLEDALKSITVEEYAAMLKPLAEEWWRTIPRTSTGNVRKMDLEEATDRIEEYLLKLFTMISEIMIQRVAEENEF